jgi:hypothetical protein
MEVRLHSFSNVGIRDKRVAHHVKWTPVHHVMKHSQVYYGQSACEHTEQEMWASDKGRSSNVGIRQRAKNSSL